MTLRRKDDWDEALEEARNNAITEGKESPVKPFVPNRKYDYAICFDISISDLTEVNE